MNRYKCPECGVNQYSASPNKTGEPCIYCGHKGTELMKEIDPNKDEIIQLTENEALAVIENRTPIGKFYTAEGKGITGIDNTTGDAWTEEFKDFGSCMRWLNREEEYQDGYRY